MADKKNALDNECNTYQYVNYGRKYKYDNTANEHDNTGNKRYHGKPESNDSPQPHYDEVGPNQIIENSGEDHYHDTENEG